MLSIDTGRLENVKTFDQLLPWLRDNLNWPIDDLEIDHEPFDNLTFEYDAARDLGLKQKDIAHIREIRQLRPLVTNQPWGIFFINFEDKKIPVGVLKRLLGGLTLKKRQSANKAEQKSWNLHDLLFISAHGKSGERELSFLHFTEENGGKNKVILKELGWDQQDTKTKLDYVAHTLKSQLAWPDNEIDPANWREKWASAFTSQHGAAIKTAKDLTKRLAQLATAIRKSVNEVLEFENKNGPLTSIYDNFKQTIFHNLTHDDFADMYAQTICYGLLAARIMRKSGGLVADDAALIAPLTQPFLKDLMETFLAVGGRKNKIDFNELGIDEVVDALYHADMDAVLRDFGNRNPNEDPIINFYEYFLRDYDSIKREQRGVYYTPLPIVRFIVRRVDEILQKKFGLEEGLADTATWEAVHKRNPGIKIPDDVSNEEPFIQILDPALGTGTFLVEVISLIEKRMKSKWRRAGKNDREIEVLWNDYVPNHLLTRLNGFELMMAPYAIAHIKIALKLAETGYKPKDNTGLRLRVYLTNTLEEPIGLGDQQTMHFISESLAQEVRGVNQIKVHTPITVVIGNPPYSGESANKGEWILELLDEYKKEPSGGRLQEKNSKWLNDDYVKFIRLGEYYVEKNGEGILAYITNHSYLDNPTFRGVRWHLMNTFDYIYILNLHGNSKKKEVAPNGKSDKNVFDIQQGVAIIVAIKDHCTVSKAPLATVQHADLWGDRQTKYNFLEKNTLVSMRWEQLTPSKNLYLFVPRNEALLEEYRAFSALTEIMKVNVLGFQTHRDYFAVDFDKEMIKKRIGDIRDIALSDDDLRHRYDLDDNKSWKLSEARKSIRSNSEWEKPIIPCDYRPFDKRYCYFDTSVMDRPRSELRDHVAWKNNLSLLVSRQQNKTGFYHIWIADNVAESCVVSLGTREQNYVFPLYLYKSEIGNAQAKHPNLDPKIYTQIKDIIPDVTAESLFDFIYAILHSPAYRRRYAEFLKSDFPRIPLPGSVALYEDIATLGHQLVVLHLLNEQEATVLFQPDTRFIGKVKTRVEKGFPKYSNGKVMINTSCHFEDVTTEVWNFHIGGYQVCEKWLKDRAGKGGKNPALGRILTEEDILHYRRITIAIRETIKLMQQIDEVINAHGGWPGAFISSN